MSSQCAAVFSKRGTITATRRFGGICITIDSDILLLSKKPPLQTYPAFYAALAEAEQIIKADKPAAAKAYIRVEQSKLPLDLVEKIVQDPEIDFTIVPQRTYIYAEKLQELGVLKNKAASWKDYFFEEAHGGNGS